MRTALSLSLLAVTALVVGAAGQEQKALMPVRSWAGRIADAGKEELRKQAPTTGTITDAKTFEKLWLLWRGDEKPPTIDFGKEIVLVHTVDGPNALKAAYTVDAQGDLKVMAASTLVAGPGFSYVIDVLQRDEFKT